MVFAKFLFTKEKMHKQISYCVSTNTQNTWGVGVGARG